MVAAVPELFALPSRDVLHGNVQVARVAGVSVLEQVARESSQIGEVGVVNGVGSDDAGAGVDARQALVHHNAGLQRDADRGQAVALVLALVALRTQLFQRVVLGGSEPARRRFCRSDVAGRAPALRRFCRSDVAGRADKVLRVGGLGRVEPLEHQLEGGVHRLQGMLQGMLLRPFRPLRLFLAGRGSLAGGLHGVRNGLVRSGGPGLGRAVGVSVHVGVAGRCGGTWRALKLREGRGLQHGVCVCPGAADRVHRAGRRDRLAPPGSGAARTRARGADSACHFADDGL